jgi:isopenicillin-N epimerase
MGAVNEFARHWQLDPAVDFLNHGSFGACPRPVLEAQQRFRDEIEHQPVEFFVRKYADRLDEAREKLGEFLGADPECLAPVPNATTGVNAVLRSIEIGAGDELLTTDHEYNACRNALDFVAARSGARVVVVEIPFRVSGADEVSQRILDSVTERTRLVLIDHVTSQTAIVFPLEELIASLAEKEVDVLVDGAHAPGMIPLDLDGLRAAYYTGNCHKWLCSPKGAAFLYAREDRRDSVRPLTISHGANSPRKGRSRFHDEFDWVGTDDPTPFLCVPASIEFLGSLTGGGWPDVMRRNHALAVRARRVVADALGVEPPCPDEMIGSLAALPLPDGSPDPPESPLYADPLQDVLLRDYRIEVPVIPWPAPPRRLLRLSAQLYNGIEQYERLAAALRERGHS